MKENIKKRIIIALILNFIIIIFEIIGLILSVKRHGIKVFQFYTENSNYFTLIVSFMFCFECIGFLKFKHKISKRIHLLRYISTTCLTVTLIIVLFVLIPMYPNTLIFMLFKDSNLYQHLLCPILSIISFLALEHQTPLPKKYVFISLIPTIIYGIICILLNLLKLITGPYPFFYVYVIPWYYSILSLTGIVIIAIFISIILYGLHNLALSKNSKNIIVNN